MEFRREVHSLIALDEKYLKHNHFSASGRVYTNRWYTRCAASAKHLCVLGSRASCTRRISEADHVKVDDVHGRLWSRLPLLCCT